MTTVIMQNSRILEKADYSSIYKMNYNLGATIYKMCDLGQVTYHLIA